MGQSITFSSRAKTGVTYTWDFGDGTSTTTGNSVTHTYNQIGTFTVLVTAQNADPNCNESQQLTVKVSCAVNATFSSPSSNATIGTPITFTNTATNATNFEWFIDGNSEGNTTDLTHTFTTQGSYFVQLVARNGVCNDTSQSVFIRVGACNQTGVANVWNFGSGAAVDFANGTPVALAGSQMSQREGVASIANVNGNLLFYTDGITVWNVNNQIMLNGTNLGGAGTSAQSSLIIPAPGSTNLYYIFTVRDWTQSGAFRYSIVDMTNDGGLGSVTTKNILIQNNINEQVTGVFHQNCQDIWIISHENRGSNPNRFAAYLLTPTGLSTTPVTSDVGFDYLGSNRYGGLRASHSGRKICTTIGGTSSGATVALFDFNRNTGAVSNQQLLADNSVIEHAYSSEFSPNDNILYVTAYNGSFIYQYDLSASSTASIRASRQNIASGKATKPVLQMGPDGKIYCTQNGQSFLGVIDNPNAMGALSNFSENAISLGSGRGNLGLPNFLPGFFGDAISISGLTTPCKNAIERYEINASSCINSIVWNYTGGGRIISQNNSSITIDFSGVVGAHNLSVQAQDQCGTISSTLSINTNNNNAPTIDLGNDTTLCSGSFVLDAGSGYADYLWEDGSTTQTLSVSTAGTYRVSVTNIQGCVSTDTIQIDTYTSPTVDLGPDSTLCFGEILVLDAGTAFDSYFWQDGSGEPTLSAYQPIPEAGTFTYFITVFDDCGNMSQDDVDITFEQCDSSICATTIANDTTICFGDSILLNASEAIDYKWTPIAIISNPNIQNPIITPTADSTYIYLTTTDSLGCESSDSLLISFYKNPIVSLKGSSTSEVCLGDSAQLEVQSDKTAAIWQWVGNTSSLSSTSIPNPIASIASTTNFTVIVTDSDGCLGALTTAVTVNLPPVLQTSGDETICKGESTTISVVEQTDYTTYKWLPSGSLTDPTTSAPEATPTQAQTTYTIEVTNSNNCVSKDSVTITVLDNPIPKIHIKGDTNICEGDTLYVTVDSSQHLGTPTLTWKKFDSQNNETILSSDSLSVIIPNLTQGETIQLFVTSDEKCVDVANRSFQSNILSPEVNIYPKLYIEGDTLVCLGKRLHLNVIDSNDVSSSYTWTNFSTQQSNTTTNPDFVSNNLFSKQLFTVSATNKNCTNTSLPYDYTFIPIQITLTTDRDTIRGGSVNLSVNTNATNFSWTSTPFLASIPENTISTTQTPLETMTFVVSGELSTCFATDSLKIVVLNDIKAPFLFSPNNDNNNDLWIIDELLNYYQTRVKIYNRWGMLIKELPDGVNSWNGNNETDTPVADGTYFYTITASSNGEQIAFTGYVTIIR